MLPRICILSYIGFTAAVFLISNLKAILILSIGLFILMIILPYRRLKSGMVAITLFLAVTFLANMLFNAGKVVYRAGPFIITEEGLYLASLRTLRVFLLIAGAKFLSIMVSMERMIAALGWFFSPLERTGLPVKNFFHTMSLSIKILPLMKKKITDEYKVRIGNVRSKGLRKKANVVFQFLLPVVFESIAHPESIMNPQKEESTHEKKQ